MSHNKSTKQTQNYICSYCGTHIRSRRSLQTHTLNHVDQIIASKTCSKRAMKVHYYGVKLQKNNDQSLNNHKHKTKTDIITSTNEQTIINLIQTLYSNHEYSLICCVFNQLVATEGYNLCVTECLIYSKACCIVRDTKIAKILYEISIESVFVYF